MARVFDGGVKFYTAGTATIPVFFPENAVVCQNCPLLTADDYVLKRCRCAATSEIIPEPQFMVGGRCPIEFEKGEENGYPCVDPR